MKIFSIFMMLLVLALAIGFCPEENYCEGKGKLEVSDIGHPKKEGNMCSPFCHCARCAFSILLPGKVSATQTEFLSEMKYPSRENQRTNDLRFSIWQPPRIS